MQHWSRSNAHRKERRYEDTLRWRGSMSVPILCTVEPAFWRQVFERKLKEWRAGEEEVEIEGEFIASHHGNNGQFQWRFHVEAWATTPVVEAQQQDQQHCKSKYRFPSIGLFKNVNSANAFRTADRSGFVRRSLQRFLKVAASIREALDKPLPLLSRDIDCSARRSTLFSEYFPGVPLNFFPDVFCPFAIISFADLKSYEVYYNIAFPTANLSIDITRRSELPYEEYIRPDLTSNSGPFDIHFLVKNQSHWLCYNCYEWLCQLKSTGRKLAKETVVHFGTAAAIGIDQALPYRPFTELLLGFLRYVCPDQERWNICHDGKVLLEVAVQFPTSGSSLTETNFQPKWLAAGPGTATFNLKLSSLINPLQLQADAVNLNIHLIRWRLLPQFNPETLAKARILIFGVGSLGCAVARNLLGWGISVLTLVDNGLVEMSSPVRQCLYTHQDAVARRLKVAAAQERLRDIRPDAQIIAVPVEVPILGHQEQESPEAIKHRVQLLKMLIYSHDYVLMMTDTRESRWLPAALTAAWMPGDLLSDESLEHCSTPPEHPETRNVATEWEEMISRAKTPRLRQPLGVTAALAFDRFVVMRHGPGDLACYFCNDLSPPGDSSIAEPLDRRCTVTRPGLTDVTAGIATELIAAHAQLGATNELEDVSCLGRIPHSIRGDVSTYSFCCPDTAPFAQCVCCSTPVKEEMHKDPSGFVTTIMRDPDVLEIVSGLQTMKSGARLDDVLVLENG